MKLIEEPPQSMPPARTSRMWPCTCDRPANSSLLALQHQRVLLTLRSGNPCFFSCTIYHNWPHHILPPNTVSQTDSIGDLVAQFNVMLEICLGAYKGRTSGTRHYPAHQLLPEEPSSAYQAYLRHCQRPRERNLHFTTQ